MTTFDSSLFAKLEDGTGYNKTNSTEVLNPYVNFYNYANTQTLQDALVAESIQMRGVECYYMPSEWKNKDVLFGEDPMRSFSKTWKFAAYLDSFEQYGGSNTFFSKFGMQVEDEITLIVNPNLFKYQVNGSEPLEGDLIYFEMDKSLFEIVWVEPYNPFYQVGSNAMRRITAKKFIYSGEKINPVLQRNDDINIPEFSELDLAPIAEVNGRHDINEHQYEESNDINIEGQEIIEPYEVVNNRGVMGHTSPFDNDFMSE
ncbi:head closure Hc2 [Acinetobacter phage Acj9]|uniref:Gp14 head completion protein n=1 Tax=Acinetobacter phage Acj9 TaxID=760939 RepID=E5EPV6_9CAUD|nr:head closure Hc2 [Acinetobacter phage Acj9]ADG60072.1 gp14 head completion protein [Acinetobacter phage Acj9]